MARFAKSRNVANSTSHIEMNFSKVPLSRPRCAIRCECEIVSVRRNTGTVMRTAAMGRLRRIGTSQDQDLHAALP